MTKLRSLLVSLVEDEQLAVRHRDHPLRGLWQGCREAHLEPDRLLIYRAQGNELHLVRTGSHSDPFEE